MVPPVPDAPPPHEATLLQAEKMELVGQLTGGLAHDFNNVLGIVVANLDRVVALLPPGDEARAAAEAALQAALRGRDLTRSLLNLARRRPNDVVVVELNDRVRSLEPLLAHALGPKITLEVALGVEDLPVLLDAGGFDSGLLNLVVNARDAMPGGGRVVLATRRTDVGVGLPPPGGAACGYAIVEIRDEGLGIDAGTLAHVLDPFFTTKPEGKGSGLGLPMVDRLCRAAGGSLAIASTPGAGTTVTLCLPCSDAPATAAAPVSAPPPASSGRPGRIMVVDDEAALLLLATTVLEAEGHAVTGVATAEEAILELQRAPYDLLFTDVMLSGRIDGVELACWAREHAPGMPIVLTSGVPLTTALEPPCAFLEKPFRIGQLADVVARALREP